MHGKHRPVHLQFTILVLFVTGGGGKSFIVARQDRKLLILILVGAFETIDHFRTIASFATPTTDFINSTATVCVHRSLLY